jgi:hypothetical protein
VTGAVRRRLTSPGLMVLSQAAGIIAAYGGATALAVYGTTFIARRDRRGRRLDKRLCLLVGGGRYVDDLGRPGMLHAVVVRSPHAHARVRRVDGRRALALPGVLACQTGADLAGVTPIPIRQGGQLA